MNRPGCLLIAAYVLLFSYNAYGWSIHQSEPWLRGFGDGLELRLQGEVFDADGAKAKEWRLSVFADGEHLSFRPSIDGNRFELWLPINQLKPKGLMLRVDSADNGRADIKKLYNFELRQAAQDGVTFTLRAPDREVEVVVHDERQPVADAQVMASLNLGLPLRVQSDAHGIARFHLFPEHRMQQNAPQISYSAMRLSR